MIKRSEQGGIAIVNTSIFIGSESKVHVLDYKGHKMNKITGITGKSHYIHTCADNRIVIINETHVLLVSQDGIPDLSYFSPDMSSPGKPASDFYGNVYIPDLLSHNIYMLLTNSNTISAVLSEKDGIHFPTAVAFDRYGKKLYVANNSGNSVKVFAIQTS
jgi:DNA-binding beta-propeller fold protein YncE